MDLSPGPQERPLRPLRPGRAGRGLGPGPGSTSTSPQQFEWALSRGRGPLLQDLLERSLLDSLASQRLRKRAWMMLGPQGHSHCSCGPSCGLACRGLAWCWSPDPALLLIPLSPPFFPAAWSPPHCLQRGQLTRAGSPGTVRVGTMLGTQVTAKRVVLSCSGRAEMLRNTPRPPESHSRTPRPAPTCTATPLPLLPLQPRGCPLLAP